jgi:hypothetical protein
MSIHIRTGCREKLKRTLRGADANIDAGGNATDTAPYGKHRSFTPVLLLLQLLSRSKTKAFAFCDSTTTQERRTATDRYLMLL